jgi:hypothetical protein
MSLNDMLFSDILSVPASHVKEIFQKGAFPKDYNNLSLWLAQPQPTGGSPNLVNRSPVSN